MTGETIHSLGLMHVMEIQPAGIIELKSTKSCEDCSVPLDLRQEGTHGYQQSNSKYYHQRPYCFVPPEDLEAVKIAERY